MITAAEERRNRKFIVDSNAELERNCAAPPVEYSAQDFDETCKFLNLDEAGEPSKVGKPPDPHKKAKSNHIRDSVRTIDDYMEHYSQVEAYISERAKEDAKFPERLRDCFTKVYRELAAGRSGIAFFGDRLFEAMVSELSRGHHQYTGPITALLVHYFAKCEVFPFKPGEEERAYDSADKTHLA